MDSASPEAKSGLIEMDGVTAGSMQDPSVAIVEAIDWAVHAGDFWVVAGLQGAGKSDFLMMTGGVMAPLAGQYRLFGEEMPIFDEARLKQRLKLGLVFDGGQLLNHLSVAENVALPLRYHRNLTAAEARPEVMRTLQEMELSPWADSTPGAIGRNWQKRAGLARALMLKPEVLLIDNPLVALDLRNLQWWLNFLDALSKGHALLDGRPVTLVVTTADLRLWKGHARQFAVLRDRRFVVLGPWNQVETASADLTSEFLPR
jgi:ABC-type transporter Mla maintaining outer membrane lipid asymmetry ATPase subunit MlaF